MKILLNGKNGEAYNMGNSNERISILELAKLVVSLVPKKELNVIVPVDALSTGKETFSADISKLKRLGWCPSVSIKTGFERTINAFEIMKTSKNKK